MSSAGESIPAGAQSSVFLAHKDRFHDEGNLTTAHTTLRLAATVLKVVEEVMPDGTRLSNDAKNLVATCCIGLWRQLSSVELLLSPLCAAALLRSAASLA